MIGVSSKLENPDDPNSAVLSYTFHASQPFGPKPRKQERKNKGKNLLALPEDYVIIDVETTGLSAEYDSLIEVAALKYRGTKYVDKFVSLIKPPNQYSCDNADGELELPPETIKTEAGEKFYYIDPYITSLTGISNVMLHSAPSCDEILPMFYQFIEGEILVGHNVHFDINFLYDAYLKLCDLPFKNDFVDTMRIARRFLPHLAHHRLKDIKKYYSIQVCGSHRAEVDCLSTNECYLQLRRDINEKHGDLSRFVTETKTAYTSGKNSVRAKEIHARRDSPDTSHPLYLKHCVFTGVLDRLSRKEAMQIVVDLGGKCQDTVTTKTNYLILGNNDYCRAIKDGKSIKQKKAEMLKLKGNDIDVIPEDVFYDMITLEEPVYEAN